MSDVVNAQAPIAPGVATHGQLMGLPYRPTPEQEAAQKAAMDKHEAMCRARETSWEDEQTAARVERYDLQNIVNRQTAIHAALMLEPKPSTPEDLIVAAGVIHGFLTATAEAQS